MDVQIATAIHRRTENSGESVPVKCETRLFLPRTNLDDVKTFAMLFHITHIASQATGHHFKTPRSTHWALRGNVFECITHDISFQKVCG